MIGIIDYGSGNVHAISNIYKKLHIPHVITADRSELKKATHLILPGVGAFDETMNVLNMSGLKDFLNEMVLGEKKPIMGICVGMQLLAEGSEEGVLEGFGWIKGQVKKFDASKLPAKPYLPHLGWNTVDLQYEHPIFSNIDHQKGFYFLHSYYFDCTSPDNVLGITEYGISYASAVRSQNVIGMQFHPEKSHRNGVELFRNFSKI